MQARKIPGNLRVRPTFVVVVGGSDEDAFHARTLEAHDGSGR